MTKETPSVINSPALSAIVGFGEGINMPDNDLHELQFRMRFMDLEVFDQEPHYSYEYPRAKRFYKEVVVPHKIAVYHEGVKLGVPYQQLVDHDLSKFTIHERGFYQHLVHNKEFSISSPWMVEALHHHYQNNKHHPEYWYRFSRSGEFLGALEMPQRYALEMVADWAAASKTYPDDRTEGGNLGKWVQKNLKNFQFHPNTLKYITAPLADHYNIYIT